MKNLNFPLSISSKRNLFVGLILLIVLDLVVGKYFNQDFSSIFKNLYCSLLLWLGTNIIVVDSKKNHAKRGYPMYVPISLTDAIMFGMIFSGIYMGVSILFFTPENYILENYSTYMHDQAKYISYIFGWLLGIFVLAIKYKDKPLEEEFDEDFG